ncbi:MAG: zf-HC2 domain-containing protein [Christensenellales bacterium]|jgi:hypothetical protein
MKLPCAMIRDLLPLYAEGLVEEETRSLIEEHLAECEECRNKLSELRTESKTPIETAKPLKSLKKQIQKRRWRAAGIAALCVFVVVFTYFYHTRSTQIIPWEEGLIEAKGIETRPSQEVEYFREENEEENREETLEVLVLTMDPRLNATHETRIEEDDGTSTVILQGYNYRTYGSYSIIEDYSEMTLYPIPDRVVYSDGNQSKPIWGEPPHGGTIILPRLALAYYAMLAAALAGLLGLLWFVFRKRNSSWIIRQLFFAPLSYAVAHLLIKGIDAASFFMEDDLCSILVMALALYALVSLAWQVLLQRKKEQ